VAERAIDFIEHPRDAKEPFFLMANFFDPHHSFGAPQEFRDMIDADAIPAPTTKTGELDEKPAPHRAYSEKSYSGTAPGYQDYTAEQIKEIRAQYWAMIALIDYEVGRILKALDDSGAAENTLVVFTSDHGEMLGNHQQLLKGPQLYDDLTRVPLIVRWPDMIPTGTQVPKLVQWLDLSATILDASGCAPGRGVQGESLLPLAAGRDIDWRPWALSEYRYSGFTTDPLIMTTMLRYEDWKLIVWHGEPACGTQRDGELYNLADDPDEVHNLYHSPDFAEQRRTMKGRLLDAMAAAEDKTVPQRRPW
jgi:arylsulfatase A-like enzyme